MEDKIGKKKLISFWILRKPERKRLTRGVKKKLFNEASTAEVKRKAQKKKYKPELEKVSFKIRSSLKEISLGF